MPDKILSLALRPRNLSGLTGQKNFVAALRNQMAKRPPSSFMLHGGAGCGKTTIARIMAISFQCPHQQLWGDPCEDCWKRQSEFSIHEINASETSGVEDAGKIAEFSRCRPMPPSLKRVIILDEAQLLTNNAQNLLLKPFEDTPAATVWIICTTSPNKILATLRRRCMSYQLKPLGIQGRELLLKKAASRIGFNKPLGELMEHINTFQIGSPGLLLMALDKFASGMSAEQSVLPETSTIDTLRICKAVTSGNWKTLVGLLKDASPEDARFIRASVAGWLKGILMRDNNPARQLVVANCLMEVSSGMAPLDDNALLTWLWGVLFKTCSKFK